MEEEIPLLQDRRKKIKPRYPDSSIKIITYFLVMMMCVLYISCGNMSDAHVNWCSVHLQMQQEANANANATIPTRHTHMPNVPNSKRAKPASKTVCVTKRGS